MKKTLLLCGVFLMSLAAYSQSQMFSVQIKATGTDGGVDISSDDAEQANDEMDKLYDDDLDMGWEGDDFNVLTTGLRFQDVNIPQGATIDSAFIEIYAHEEETDGANITIWGENNDDPQTFDTVNLITDRPATSASVTWNITEQWEIWTQYRTPDIKGIVQEIVDRSGWASGNSMVIIVQGEDQGASAEDNARDFESFENEEDPNDGGDGLNHPERIPKLVVYYDGVVGINNPAASNGLSIYPNPSAGMVTVNLKGQTQGEMLNILISDISGRTVHKSTTGNGEPLNVCHLTSGMYHIQVNNAGTLHTELLFIK